MLHMSGVRLYPVLCGFVHLTAGCLSTGGTSSETLSWNCSLSHRAGWVPKMMVRDQVDCLSYILNGFTLFCCDPNFPILSRLCSPYSVIFHPILAFFIVFCPIPRHLPLPTSSPFTISSPLTSILTSLPFFFSLLPHLSIVRGIKE